MLVKMQGKMDHSYIGGEYVKWSVTLEGSLAVW